MVKYLNKKDPLAFCVNVIVFVIKISEIKRTHQFGPLPPPVFPVHEGLVQLFWARVKSRHPGNGSLWQRQLSPPSAQQQGEEELGQDVTFRSTPTLT